MPTDPAIIIPGFAVSLNSGAPRHRINLRESPVLQNFTLKDGVARKRPGYTLNAGSSWTGLFYKGHHIQDTLSGAEKFWGFGSTMASHKSAIGGNWTDATNSMTLSTYTNDSFWTSCEVSSLNDNINHLISCNADTKKIGGEFMPVFQSIPGTDLLVKLTGGNSYQDSDNYHYCKAVMSWGDRPVLMHTYEEVSAGVWAEWFQRLRWSKAGYFEANDDWDRTLLAGASYWDFKNDYGPVMNGTTLGNVSVIWQRDAIHNGYLTNDTAAPFYFEPKIEDFGLWSWRLWAKGGDSIFFVGSDDQIYRYFGGKDFQNIGRKIRTEFFANINMSASATATYFVRDRAFCFTIPQLQAVVFAIPTGTGDNPVKYPSMCYLYFWNEDRWEHWSLADALTGAGIYEDPVGKSLRKLPIVGASNAKLYELNQTEVDDRVNNTEVAIDAQIQTQELVLDMKNDYQVGNIIFEASGNGAVSTVEISASYDDGANFETAKTAVIGTGWGNHKVPFDFSRYKFRLKFANAVAGEDLLLADIRIEINEAGEDI